MNEFYVSYVKRALPLKQLALLLILSIIAITAGIVLFFNLSRDIKVYDNGKPIQVVTMGASIGQALGQLGISVGEDDYISASMEDELNTDGTNVLMIKRAVPLKLVIDGQTQDIMSYRDTVSEVVKDNGITMGELDRFEGVKAEDAVASGMTVRIVRVKEELLAEQESVPYTVVEQPNKTMNSGEKKTINEGENGILEKYYKITYEDGKTVARDYVEEKLVKEPVNKLVEYGTVQNFKNSRGELVRYSKVLKLKATAYTASFADTGKNPGDWGFGITYTGLQVREGVIAVDPSVIPLGTKVYVEVPGSQPDYGFAIAADTGSAIKGNLIDLYFDTTAQAKNWGRRNVVVYILNEQNDTRWKLNDDPWK